MMKKDIEIIILNHIKENETNEDFEFSIFNIDSSLEGVKIDLILHDLITNGYILGLSSRLSSNGNIILNVDSSRLSNIGESYLKSLQ